MEANSNWPKFWKWNIYWHRLNFSSASFPPYSSPSTLNLSSLSTEVIISEVVATAAVICPSLWWIAVGSGYNVIESGNGGTIKSNCSQLIKNGIKDKRNEMKVCFENECDGHSFNLSKRVGEQKKEEFLVFPDSYDWRGGRRSESIVKRRNGRVTDIKYFATCFLYCT